MPPRSRHVRSAPTPRARPSSQRASTIASDQSRMSSSFASRAHTSSSGASMQAELRKAITFAVSRITPGGSISREMSLSSRQPASRGRAAPRGGAGFSSVRRQWGAPTDVTLHSRGGRRVKFAVAVVSHIRAHSREDHRNPEPIKAGCQAVRVNTTSSSPSEADAHSPDQTRARLRGAGVREALAFCAERRNLRRTVRIGRAVPGRRARAC